MEAIPRKENLDGGDDHRGAFSKKKSRQGEGKAGRPEEVYTRGRPLGKSILPLLLEEPLEKEKGRLS